MIEGETKPTLRETIKRVLTSETERKLPLCCHVYLKLLVAKVNGKLYCGREEISVRSSRLVYRYCLICSRGIPTLYWPTPTPTPVVGGVPFCRLTAKWCSIPICGPFPFILPEGWAWWGCWCGAESREIGEVLPFSRSSAWYSCSKTTESI